MYRLGWALSLTKMQSLLFVGIILLSAAQPARSRYLGCFQYYYTAALNGKSTTSNSMTVELCQGLCQQEDVLFYGIEGSSKCLCGNVLRPSVKKSDKDCNAKCSGNEKQFCGGDRKIRVYRNSNYEKGYLGCFLDKGMFIGKSIGHYTVNVDVCKTFCEKRNGQYYGLEHGNVCICGDVTAMIRKHGSECNKRCQGNRDQFCGGHWKISLYINRKYDNGYIGCFQYHSLPPLNVRNNSSTSMTVEKCKRFCQKEDVQFYGIEDSSKCLCGNALTSSVRKSDNECNAKCSGNKKQFCGGDRTISVFKNPYYERGYLGCFLDKGMIIGKSIGHYTVNVDVCKTFCEKRNGQYYGLEHGNVCICGDVTAMIRKHEIECNKRCKGNRDQFCGGHWKISLYINRKYDNGYIGCFQYHSAPPLNVRNNSSTSMTVEKCKRFCQKEDVQFYGIEGSSKCLCGNSLTPSFKKSDKECGAKCSGNEKQFCGGDRKISVFKNPYYEKGYLGCFLDRGMFIGKSFGHYTVNVNVCKTFCEKRNGQYYGLEHGNVCICGDVTAMIRKPESECNERCKGNRDQFCGGHWKISLYINRKYDNGYLGCFQYYSVPSLNIRHNSSASMTVEKCKRFCQKEDVKFYGIEGSNKCLCGNALTPSIKKSDNECSAKCSGNKKQFCGGDRKISVFKNPYYDTGYVGCFLDQPPKRTLNGKSLSHHIMNVDVCKTFCEQQNAKYYGLEHGNVCICGDVIAMIRKRESECNERCKGNRDQFCGGHWKISLYINRKYDNSNMKDGN